MALKKTCTCGKIIDYSKQCCDECNIKREQNKAQRYKHYDKNIRDKETTSFYNSDEWERTRTEVLRNYKGLDLYEYYINKKIVYVDAVHHIVELKDDWSKRIDISNLIPMTSSTHGMIHKLYKKDKQGTQKLLFELLKSGKVSLNRVGVSKKFLMTFWIPRVYFSSADSPH